MYKFWPLADWFLQDEWSALHPYLYLNGNWTNSRSQTEYQELLQILICSHARPDCTVPAQPQLIYPGRVASINAYKRLTLNPTHRLKTIQCNSALWLEEFKVSACPNYCLFGSWTLEFSVLRRRNLDVTAVSLTWKSTDNLALAGLVQSSVFQPHMNYKIHL